MTTLGAPDPVDLTVTDSPRVRRDFALLWTGQTVSLLGDQFAVLALPLLAVSALDATPAHAALLPFALFVPFLPLGLPAGAIVDRVSRRVTMLVCSALQLVVFSVIWVLAATDALNFPLLFALVLLGGCAVVFFQVAYTAYLPTLYREPGALHRGNARLAMSESTSRSLGPMIAGPVIQAVGVAASMLVNALSFLGSVLTLAAIRNREPAPEPTKRGRGWLRRDIAAGVRFVIGHPLLQPVVLCGAIYVLFLSVVEASLILYCRYELGLEPVWIGVVVGAAAGGYPIGNLLSSRLAAWIGMPRALMVSATVSVTGIVAMPALGSLGGAAGATGLVVASVVHSIGEGSFAPTALTLRQTVTPPGMLGRVSSVQRFLLWGAIPVGSLIASGCIATIGLAGAMWVGAIGTVLCLPALFRGGVRTAILERS